MTAVALALAACGSGIVMVRSVGWRVHDVDDALQYAANGYDVALHVHGNPFDVAKSRLDGAVAAAMRGAHPGPPVIFTSNPDANVRRPYKVVMMFDPPLRLTPYRLCAETDLPAASPQQDRIIVMAAFCYGDGLQSAVLGEIGGAIATPEDPGFGRLITQTSMELFASGMRSGKRG